MQDDVKVALAATALVGYTWATFALWPLAGLYVLNRACRGALDELDRPPEAIGRYAPWGRK